MEQISQIGRANLCVEDTSLWRLAQGLASGRSVV